MASSTIILYPICIAQGCNERTYKNCNENLSYNYVHCYLLVNIVDQRFNGETFKVVQREGLFLKECKVHQIQLLIMF